MGEDNKFPGAAHLVFHIEINGENVCGKEADGLQNGVGRSNNDGTNTHSLEPEYTKENFPLKSWDQKMYSELAGAGQFSAINPWCWKQWLDLNSEKIGAPMQDGACHTLPQYFLGEPGGSCGSMPSISTLEECRFAIQQLKIESNGEW